MRKSRSKMGQAPGIGHVPEGTTARSPWRRSCARIGQYRCTSGSQQTESIGPTMWTTPIVLRRPPPMPGRPSSTTRCPTSREALTPPHQGAPLRPPPGGLLPHTRGGWTTSTVDHRRGPESSCAPRAGLRRRDRAPSRRGCDEGAPWEEAARAAAGTRRGRHWPCANCACVHELVQADSSTCLMSMRAAPLHSASSSFK